MPLSVRLSASMGLTRMRSARGLTAICYSPEAGQRPEVRVKLPVVAVLVSQCDEQVAGLLCDPAAGLVGKGPAPGADAGAAIGEAGDGGVIQGCCGRGIEAEELVHGAAAGVGVFVEALVAEMKHGDVKLAGPGAGDEVEVSADM